MPKNKRRSCGLCKPHKRGWTPRDTDRHRMIEREAEDDINEGRGRAVIRVTDALSAQPNSAAGSSRRRAR